MAHGRDQHTDRQADHANVKACNNSAHLALLGAVLAMQTNNKT